MDNQNTNQSVPGAPGPLLVLGIVLILVGGFIALFIVQEVLVLYQQIDNNAFVTELISRFKNSDILFFGGEALSLSEQGATIIAMVLFILFALLGIHIAVAFIRAGVHIVSPAFPFQLAQLKLRIEKLREKVAGK